MSMRNGLNLCHFEFVPVLCNHHLRAFWTLQNINRQFVINRGTITLFTFGKDAIQLLPKTFSFYFLKVMALNVALLSPFPLHAPLPPFQVSGIGGNDNCATC